jgi:hypothetical protein
MDCLAYADLSVCKKYWRPGTEVHGKKNPGIFELGHNFWRSAFRAPSEALELQPGGLAWCSQYRDTQLGPYTKQHKKKASVVFSDEALMSPPHMGASYPGLSIVRVFRAAIYGALI